VDAMHGLLKRQLRRCFGEESSIPALWLAFVNSVNDAYRDFDADRALLEHSLQLSSQELFDANSELLVVFQAIPDLVFLLDQSGTIVDIKAGTPRDLMIRRQDLIGKRIQSVPLVDVARQFSAAIEQVTASNSPVGIEYLALLQDQASHFEARLVPLPDRQIVVIIRNTTAPKQAQAELDATHRQLVESSRQAGMAEIATNVLHNVGNILNSVNVSVGVVSSTLRDSRAHGLSRAVQLMHENAADLGHFLTHDVRGKLLPGYLSQLAQTLALEQQGMMQELQHLATSIDHIKGVVATQQSSAGKCSIIEPVQIGDLLDDALRMNDGMLARHGVSVVREFADVPLLMLDRSQLLQIMVNLISNARHAMESMPGASQQITLRVEHVAGTSLRVAVRDVGEGIPAENLTRIFVHGFTTRKTGHGFGLHSCALAARQMGGTLTAHSDGHGQGATFTLEIPINNQQSQP
jgi:signal transduction histidine kinase